MKKSSKQEPIRPGLHERESRNQNAEYVGFGETNAAWKEERNMNLLEAEKKLAAAVQNPTFKLQH
jgi:hypothetical protein